MEVKDDIELTDEKLIEDSRRIAEILFQICALVNYNFRELIMVVTYGVVHFVMAMANNAGRDVDNELSMFAVYVHNICKAYEKTKNDDKESKCS